MPSHHTILSLTTQSSRFFGDATFTFADGLNTLMAGRGCGKTSLLYLVRFALGAAVPAAYAKELDEHVRDVLGAGTVTVQVRTQHGVHYSSSRAVGEDAKVRNAAGELVDVSLDGDLFRVDAYAAKEIERMPDQPDAQLALIDRFAPAEMRRFGHALDDVARRIAQAGVEVDRLAAEIATDEGREGELPAIVEALKGLALGDPSSDDELAKAEARRPARGREQNAMKGLAAEIANVQRALDLFAREAQRRLVAAVEGELERTAEPIGPLFRRAHEAVHRAAGAIEASAGRLRADLASAEGAVAVEMRALAGVHDVEDETYKALVARKDTDHGRALQREDLHRRRDALDALGKRLADRRRDHERKRAEHSALLAERETILRERFELRERLCAEITAAARRQVKVTVTRGGMVKAYEALLLDVLAGSGLPKELIEQIAYGIPPEELYGLVLRDDEAPIVLVDKMKTGKTARAHKVIAALRASGRLREIETAPTSDMPLIELKIGDDYHPSARVSTGQKCTAILPILLLPSANPLLIDQVEDHLDNRFIYEVLVKTLLHAKAGRQFLFATHNPNIPVLADAERVFELDAPDRHGRVVAVGDVEEMRGRIEAVLEGGREAFVRRGERYGHLPKKAPPPPPPSDDVVAPS